MRSGLLDYAGPQNAVRERPRKGITRSSVPADSLPPDQRPARIDVAADLQVRAASANPAEAITAANLVPVELQAGMRRRLLDGAHETVLLEWFGSKVAVRFNQPFEAEAFRRRYRDFLTAGAPDLTVCATGADDEDPVFFAEPGSAWRYPAILRRPGLIAFLADAVTQQAFFGHNDRIVSFHAAAVHAGSAAVALAATSTGGKTTTSLACARRGMPVYTDERCVVLDGRVHAFPRAMNVRAGGIDLLASENVRDDGDLGRRLRAHAGKDWEFVHFSELFGARPLPKPQRLDSILFITGKALTPAIEPLEREAALAHLLGSSFCGPRPGMDRVAAAAAMLHHVRPFSLTLGKPDETALLIEATARCQRSPQIAARP